VGHVTSTSFTSIMRDNPSALLVIFNSATTTTFATCSSRSTSPKRWTDPVPTDPKLLAQQDEEIFQTARLVKWVGG
jgi:hypothetical protein